MRDHRIRTSAVQHTAGRQPRIPHQRRDAAGTTCISKYTKESNNCSANSLAVDVLPAAPSDKASAMHFCNQQRQHEASSPSRVTAQEYTWLKAACKHMSAAAGARSLRRPARNSSYCERHSQRILKVPAVLLCWTVANSFVCIGMHRYVYMHVLLILAPHCCATTVPNGCICLRPFPMSAPLSVSGAF